MTDFVLCSIKSYYSEKIFQKLKKNTEFTWQYISENEYFKENILEINPKKCFFIHWPFIVPKRIYEIIECINFHTANLPNGRGGTPIQNQILDKTLITKVNSLKITSDGLDSGPCYNFKTITLQGNVFDIFITISDLCYELILDIIYKNLKPNIIYNYQNEIIYKRIKNNELNIEDKELEDIYDQIRMRDSDYYEKTYINIGNFKFSFNRALFNGNKIKCDVEIIKNS